MGSPADMWIAEGRTDRVTIIDRMDKCKLKECRSVETPHRFLVALLTEERCLWWIKHPNYSSSSYDPVAEKEDMIGTGQSSTGPLVVLLYGISRGCFRGVGDFGGGLHPIRVDVAAGKPRD